jgi:hypothetical protein
MKNIQIKCVGYSIAADLYENGYNKVLLVLPGWSSNKRNQEDLTNYLVNQTKTSALVVDYSGHGESPFDAMEVRPSQHFLEVITAFDWVKQAYPNAEISVMGTSYGGYLAAQLTEYRDFKNLVLRVPAVYAPQDFYSLNKYIDRQHERRYREDKEFLDNHPLLAHASKFEGRTLVVWHEFDEYVPKETTDKYIRVFKADSYFAKGWTHSFKTDAPEEEKNAYKNAISNWLNQTSSKIAR